MQLAWPGGTALVDPLAVGTSELARLFASDAVAVLHAAQQDLDVLGHAIGAIPRHIYDTQIAASFVGYSTPSLVVLVQGELGVTPAKGDRLTDWLRRPLSEAQKDYAAADVRYLLELQDRLDAVLAGLGRTEWVAAACEELRLRPIGAIDPKDAWSRLKDVRTLRGRSRAVAQSLAEWREREAQALDVPVRQVLPDLAVLGIAQRQPSTLDELAQCRGVDHRHRQGRVAREVLAAVERGQHAAPPPVTGGGDDVERALRPAVALISAWVSQVAKDERIDTGMLATRADLVALLGNDPNARLSTRVAGRAARRRHPPAARRQRRTHLRPRGGIAPDHGARRRRTQSTDDAAVAPAPVECHQCQFSSLGALREEGSSSPLRGSAQAEAVRSRSIRSGVR